MMRRLPKGKSLDATVAWIIKKYETDLVAHVYYILGGTDQKWGHDPFLVFYHMGLVGDDLAQAVYLLVMETWGHGIGLNDDYSSQFEMARDILRMISDDTSPMYLEQCNMTQIFEDDLPYVGHLVRN